MKHLRTTTLAVLALAIALAGPAPRASAAPTDDLLTNESIAEMARAGLGADVILAKLRTSQTDFDVSVDALIQLKNDGVPDEVIEAMIAVTPSKEPDRTPLGRDDPATAPPPVKPAPPTPAQSGIYYARTLGQEEDLILLEPSVYTQSKETGVWKRALTYGIVKIRYKAVLPGAHAIQQIQTRRPTFYFYFDVTTGSLSGSGSSWGPATSANEFILARMDVKKKTREIEVGEDGQYTGRKYGVSEKAVQPFDFERLGPGVYRVTPKADLEDGEYCFLFAGSVAASGAGGGPKLFDFGVKAPAKERSRRVSKGSRR